MVGCVMRFFSNGINYHLQVHQNRQELPWLLMLHGFMGSSGSFTDLVEPLSEFCNPVTIDLLGHGNTAAPPDPKRFESGRQVADLASVISRLQAEKLFLYGYSMGGRLAVQFAVNHPQSITGLILESTHCGIRDEAERNARAEEDELRACRIESGFEDFLDEWAKLPLFNPPGAEPDHTYLNRMKKQNPEAMATSLRGFSSGLMPYACGQLAALQLPIGLVAGEFDKKYVEKMGEMAHLCKNADFNSIGGAAHRVHADQPKQIVQYLNHFITENYG